MPDNDAVVVVLSGGVVVHTAISESLSKSLPNGIRFIVIDYDDESEDSPWISDWEGTGSDLPQDTHQDLAQYDASLARSFVADEDLT